MPSNEYEYEVWTDLWAPSDTVELTQPRGVHTIDTGDLSPEPFVPGVARPSIFLSPSFGSCQRIGHMERVTIAATQLHWFRLYIDGCVFRPRKISVEQNLSSTKWPHKILVEIAEYDIERVAREGAAPIPRELLNNRYSDINAALLHGNATSLKYDWRLGAPGARMEVTRKETARVLCVEISGCLSEERP